MVHLVSLILTLPLWAQSIAFPAAPRVEYVDSLPAGITGYAYTTAQGEILLTPECRKNDEILMQCVVHEGVHLQGHGECLAYLAQYIFSIDAHQSDESIIWARDLYLRYGEPACRLNDVECYDKH